MSDASVPAGSISGLRQALLGHYDRTARDLPWRRETDPYRIWVSEVMLQQTRVETVLGYYDEWLDRFPDLDTLACADVDDVLKAWEGLGYYRRARNLHRGAALVRESFGGAVPGSYAELRELPGVGEYTAGAVASIAFGESVPAVDGNVRRVLARLCDVADPKPAWLRRTASELVDPDRPGDWNQALMELGATVCTPTKPKCDGCPVSAWCGAWAAGTQGDRPAPPRRKAVPTVTFATAVVVDEQGRRLVARRPEGGLLAGMWSFPEGALDEDGMDDGDLAGRIGCVARAVSLAREVGAELVDGVEPDELAPVRHRFTHLDATYRPVLLRGSGTGTETRRWLSPEDLTAVALPVAQQKIEAATAAALQQD